MSMRLRSGCRGGVAGLIIAAALWAVVLGVAVPPTAAAPLIPTQEWWGPEPGEGEAGSTASVSGNLIGCYGSGPGELSSTWGFPDRVALYFDSEVRESEDSEAFVADLVEDPSSVEGMEEVASFSFGEAGWTLDFTVPDAEPGPHLMVLSFQPQCNHNSVEAPDGFTDEPSNSVLSFCITEDGVCPPATPVVDLFPPTEEEEDPESRIIVAVGTIGAVAAAAAAAAAAAGPNDGSGDDEEEELAIVQVSEASIDVYFDEPARLELTGWKAKGGNIERVAMDLWIEAPPDSGLIVEPDRGTGQLVANLTLDDANFDPDLPEVTIVAHGSWDGKEATQDVTVYLVGEEELYFWDGGLTQVEWDDFDEGDLRA